MRRWYLSFGLIGAMGGCTASQTSPSERPETADSVVDAPTTSAHVDAGATPAQSSGEGRTTSNQGPTPSTGAQGEGSTSELGPLEPVTGEGNDAGVRTLVSCDPRKVVCKVAEPLCEYGYVRRIVDGCYAECVRIDECVCSGADACPQRERYTCNNSRQRCTPYLN